MEEVETMSENLKRSEWRIKQAIAKIIIDLGGVIFGGFVRDTLLHDYWAKKYYEEATNDGFTTEYQNDHYNDSTVYPETLSRQVIPNDIDCYIEDTSMLGKIETALVTNKYSFRRIFVRHNASVYIQRLNVPDNTLLHIRYKVYCLDTAAKYKIKTIVQDAIPTEFRSATNEIINSLIASMHDVSLQIGYVTLDVLVKKKPEIIVEPPFGNIDFECNALTMSKNGIQLSNQLVFDHGIVKSTARAFKLVKILQDIVEKKAVAAKNTTPMDHYRFCKMKLSGWNIDIQLNTIIEIPPPPDYDINEKDICIICHDNLEEQHYKLKCCSAKYHKNCLLQSINEGTSAMVTTLCCIVCKRTANNIENEGIMLSYLES